VRVASSGLEATPRAELAVTANCSRARVTALRPNDLALRRAGRGAGVVERARRIAPKLPVSNGLALRLRSLGQGYSPTSMRVVPFRGKSAQCSYGFKAS
jgi:hypothetical protein